MADCKHRQPEDGCGMCRDKREIARLTEQRDALLAACEAMDEWADGEGEQDDRDKWLEDVIREMRAALEKARSK